MLPAEGRLSGRTHEPNVRHLRRRIAELLPYVRRHDHAKYMLFARQVLFDPAHVAQDLAKGCIRTATELQLEHVEVAVAGGEDIDRADVCLKLHAVTIVRAVQRERRVVRRQHWEVFAR